MKLLKVLSLMLAISLPALSHAAILNAPFQPEVDARFNALEGPSFINLNYANFGADSVAVKHTAQATWDFAVQGGASALYDLHVQVPKNAIITRSYLYSTTQPTTSTSGTLSFLCQNAGDIKASTLATSYATAASTIEGVSTGSASTFKYITAACDIQASIATGPLTAGKVTAFVEYVIHQ